MRSQLDEHFAIKIVAGGHWGTDST